MLSDNVMEIYWRFVMNLKQSSQREARHSAELINTPKSEKISRFMGSRRTAIPCRKEQAVAA